MWISVNNQRIYKTIIDESVIPDVSKGVYTSIIRYRGAGERLGYFIMELESLGIYIMSNMVSDSINLTSNYPKISSGVYSFYESKQSINNSSIFTDGSNYILLDETLIFKYLGSILMLYEDPQEDLIRYNRTGSILTSNRIFKSTSNLFDSVEINNIPAKTTYLRSVSESDAGVTQIELTANAISAFRSNNYSYQFSPDGSFSGWYSSSISGEYQPFGGKTGVEKVGYLNYIDTNLDTYTKGFEIIQDNDSWTVVYKPNSEIYYSNTEPTENTTIFTNENAEPTSIALEFNGYVSREKECLTVMIAEDIYE